MNAEEEYKKKIYQNTNFFKFVEENIFQKSPKPDDMEKYIDNIHAIGEKMFPLEDFNKQLLERGYSKKNMEELITLQMDCALLWSVLFGKDKSEYYSKF